MENITFIISIPILLFLLFRGAEKAKKKEFIENYFSLENSKGIQGYFAVGIIMHHCSVWLWNMDKRDNLFVLYFYIPLLLVGFFFFCSGYGLITSLYTKENYLKGFIQKRVLMVLVPFFICNYIYMLTSQLYGEHYTIPQLISAFFGLLLINNQMWFAVEIMVLYLIFYLIFRYVKKEKLAFGLMGVATIALIIIALAMGHGDFDYEARLWFHGEWWYNTTIFFFIGMLFARFKTGITDWLKKHYVSVTIISITLFILFFMGNFAIINEGIYWTDTYDNRMILDKVKGLCIQTPMVFFFLVLVQLIMMKIRFHNRQLSFLGTISLEIILINYLFIICFDFIRIQYGMLLYLILVVICTLCIAIFLNYIKQIILERDRKKTHII